MPMNSDRPTLVRAFVQRMPKGGDIHTHLSGAVYAEHYLQWAADELCRPGGVGPGGAQWLRSRQQ